MFVYLMSFVLIAVFGIAGALVRAEVGISYSGRIYAEGNKIAWKDGFRALYCLGKIIL